MRRSPALLAFSLAIGVAAGADPVSLAVATGADATRPETEPVSLHVAARLDTDGRLDEALPLYAARAQQTLTRADRLRWAGALLRDGQRARARTVLDQLSAETGSVEHGGRARTVVRMACASTALMAGVPGVAVAYARAAAAADPGDPGAALLLVRALAAAGEPGKARAVLARAGRDPLGWTDARVLELARWQLAAGDEHAGSALLERPVRESLVQMLQDSVRADVALRAADWPRAATLLDAAARKVPRAVDDDRVDSAWRNVQRELRWVQLRRAVARARLGQRAAAVADARRAQLADESYVRAAATLVVVADALSDRRVDEARAALRVLGGRDRRFREAATWPPSGARDEDTLARVQALAAALASTDRSAAHVTAGVETLLTQAAAPTRPAMPAGAAARRDRGARASPPG